MRSCKKIIVRPRIFYVQIIYVQIIFVRIIYVQIFYFWIQVVRSKCDLLPGHKPGTRPQARHPATSQVSG